MATSRQDVKLLSVFQDVDQAVMQEHLGTGVFADIRDADPNVIKEKRDEVRKLWGLPSLTLPLLTHVEDFTIPALVGFNSDDLLAEIKYPNEGFKKEFGGMKVATTAQVDCVSNRLERGSTDKLILSHIGEEKAEMSLTHLRWFIANKAQRLGWYVMYILNKKGVLRAVNFFWNGDDWLVLSVSVEGPVHWGAGGQFVSSK